MTDNPPVPGASAHRRVPAWLVRAATRAQALLADSTWLLALTLLFNLVVVFATAAVWYARGGDITLVGAVLGALLVLSGGMLPLIKGRGQDGEDKPLWPPLMLLVVPVAVLAVALPSLAWSVYVNSCPVTLTQDFELSPSGPFREGKTVHATAHVDHPRSRLFITFAAPQHREADPVCAPSGRLRVTLASGSGSGHQAAQSGKAGEELAFSLGQDRKDIRLAVRMTAEPNCVLDLSVASARVDD
ncbi:hypothetical protein [Streptomyces sp. NPDC048172]|uniref:hypothetical protein n=1 Tax=Streptomyces sp. NPDC048172 TaxID=3365505 RepID=UPI00371DF383